VRENISNDMKIWKIF